MALTISLHQQGLHHASKAAMAAANPSQNFLSRTHFGDGQASIPPFLVAKTKDEEPVTPPLHVFESLVEPKDANRVPTVGECATHLELLQVFHTLRVKVLQSRELDQTFGIRPSPVTVWRRTGHRKRERVQLKDATFASRRVEKWPLFLSLAVVRFQIWIAKADSALPSAPRESEGAGLNNGDAAVSSLLQVLPPLGTAYIGP